MRWIMLWAGFLAVLAALTLLFHPGPFPPLLLGGAALGTFVLGLAAARAVPAHPTPAAPPASTLPAVGVAMGVAALVGGTELGQWLEGIGAGVLVLSLGMLLQERRAG
jgi:hypothetical protein